MSAIHSVIGLAFLLPMLWVIDAAFSVHASPLLTRPSFTLVNFRSALSLGAGRAIENSLYLAVVSTVIATAVSVLAGYALSRRRVPLKGTLLVGTLVLSGLPITLLLIPIYIMYVHLELAQLALLHLASACGLLSAFCDLAPEELYRSGSKGVRGGCGD